MDTIRITVDCIKELTALSFVQWHGLAPGQIADRVILLLRGDIVKK